MEHPAFADAGGEPGVKIWTIDKFEPVEVEQQMYGKFYNGDAYIVLKTTGDKSSTLSHDAHFWLGAKSTQDKQGSAAILTVTLDDMLAGKAVHHREVQGHESGQFLGYFKPAVRYLEGGNESGFNEVEINAGAEKRLLKLSGADNMRIEEVPAEASSLTRDNCFILEVEHDIFVLVPEGSKATQRRKIISVANKLRDEDHNGRASIEIIDEFSSEEDLRTFFEALGSGSMDDLEDDTSSNSYTRDSSTAVYLYKILVNLEEDTIEPVELDKPFKEYHLSSYEIYILDTPDSGVYIWLGKDADPEVRKAYYSITQMYLEMKGYPAWVNVTRVSEGSESGNFKQYFHQWDSSVATESDGGYYSSDGDETSVFKIGKSAAARGYMPDEGSGDLVITRVDDENETLETSILYSGEAYVIKYQFPSERSESGNETVIYIWIGAKVDADKNAKAVQLAEELESEEYKDTTVVLVPQGKEPKHLLSIFKGGLGILLGSQGNPESFNGTYEDDGVRLFKVEGTELNVDMKALQVPEKADQLEDDDVFVLETKEVVYVRNGKESLPEEEEAALAFVKLAVGEAKEIVQFKQGDEPEEFWEPLGGAPDADENEAKSGWKSSASRRVTTPPSLYSVTVTIKGKIKVEELADDFSQQDLSEDGVYILDVGEEIYMWEGASVPERVKKARTDIVKEYIKDDGLDRSFDNILVVGVKQDREPKVFKKHFPEWDADMWSNQTSYEDMKSEAKAANSK
ncbi:gelsolin repeat domain-containing protein [Phthorimaea operculella]|nr:gelsolin repeat domain-containing protein [Phthorimaea operculella]